MAWIILPRHFAARAELYHQLNQLTSAGIGLMEAIAMQQARPPLASFAKPLDQIFLSLQMGSTFAQAVEKQGEFISKFDAALLSAGEKSGRLPECFRLLANYYDER